jgi:hypothetical protein
VLMGLDTVEDLAALRAVSGTLQAVHE